MSRLLSRPVLRDVPATLHQPAPTIDPALRRLIDDAAADGYERGRAEGYREGFETGGAEATAAAAVRVERLRDAVVSAFEQVLAVVREVRDEQARTVVQLAAATAEAVLGREPGEGGQALLRRVGEALDALDDRPLVLRVCPPDVEPLRRGLADVHDLRVEPDESLAAGEARVLGRWAQAELTRAAAWSAVREVLDDA